MFTLTVCKTLHISFHLYSYMHNIHQTIGTQWYGRHKLHQDIPKSVSCYLSINRRWCYNKMPSMTEQNLNFFPIHSGNQESSLQGNFARHMVYETCMCIYNRCMLFAQVASSFEGLNAWQLFLANNFAAFPHIVVGKKAKISIIGGVLLQQYYLLLQGNPYIPLHHGILPNK